MQGPGLLRSASSTISPTAAYESMEFVCMNSSQPFPVGLIETRMEWIAAKQNSTVVGATTLAPVSLCEPDMPQAFS